MTSFVKTYEQPPLSHLTIAYEVLEKAVADVHAANRAVEDDWSHVAALRQQAARKPLVEAMHFMREKLDQAIQVACFDTPSDWPHWQVDALDVNIAAATQLLDKARELYWTIPQYRSNGDRKNRQDCELRIALGVLRTMQLPK